MTITTGALNDVMTVTIQGMPAGTSFDLFVIQQPGAPFGVSWYQTDIHANSSGTGSATVRGVFDSETFSVSGPVRPADRRHYLPWPPRSPGSRPRARSNSRRLS